MTAEELKTKQDNFSKIIRSNAEKHGLIKQKPFLEPIYDGVADIDGYLESNPKIMWLLKEPYDDLTPAGKSKGGGWSIINDIFNNTDWSDFWKSSSMWQQMIKINYAIHHNYITWRKIPQINEEIANELKKSVYININKMPGDKKSPAAHLKRCYNNWRDILIKQIKLYKPDIIIFGYTFQFFNEDPFFDGYKYLKTFNDKKWGASAHKKNNLILIDAYHPAQKGDGKYYVDNIVKAVKYAMQK